MVQLEPGSYLMLGGLALLFLSSSCLISSVLGGCGHGKRSTLWTLRGKQNLSSLVSMCSSGCVSELWFAEGFIEP